MGVLRCYHLDIVFIKILHLNWDISFCLDGYFLEG